MPTRIYNWSFPTLGQGSWHAAFVSAINSIAMAVTSVERQVAGHQNLMTSAYCTTSFAVQYNGSGFLNGTAGNSVWTPVSFAPFGPAVSTFTLVGCQTAAFIQSVWRVTVGSAPAAAGIWVYLRGVLNGSRELLNSNSLTLNPISGIVAPVQASWKNTFVQSLAAGTYGLTWEFRAFTAATASTFILWNPGDSFLVSFQETGQGG